MNKESLIGVSEAARRIGIAETTLRRYDRAGIVSPLRDSAGRRLFSAEDIKTAKKYRAQHGCRK